MSRHLRAVGDAEAPPAPAKTLAEAATRDRRAWLVTQRKIIADQVDAGVPAHALARLLGTANEIDAEIRRLDAADEEEAQRAGGSSERRSFNASAL